MIHTNLSSRGVALNWYIVTEGVRISRESDLTTTPDKKLVHSMSTPLPAWDHTYRPVSKEFEVLILNESVGQI